MAKYIEIESAIEELKNKDYIKLKSQEDRVREIFDLCPAEEVQPIVYAHWIDQTNDDLAINDFQCSKCNYWTEYDTKYCPNCGAKMKEVEE